MPHAIGPIAVGGEGTHPLPPVQFLEVRCDLSGECDGKPQPKRLGSDLEGVPEV